MDDDQTLELTDEQIAEIQSSDLYKVVKYVFSDESNDPEQDYFLLLTQFFNSILQTAALNSEIIAKAVWEPVISQLVGAPKKSEGGIILPNSKDRAGIEVQA